MQLKYVPETGIATSTCPIPRCLEGQVALVTGASSGIGRAIAVALGQAGAAVGVNFGGNKAAADAVVKGIESLGSRAMAIQADVSDEGQVLAMFESLTQRLGVLDVLVNNAGIQKDAPFDEMTAEQWDSVMAVNLRGQFLCAREAVRAFKRHGVRRDISCAAGKIICVSSVHEVIPWAGHVNYAASKGGMTLYPGFETGG